MRYLLLLAALLTFQSVNALDFDETKALADQGDADAQYNLGVMYGKGRGIPQNDAEAVKWYRKAAEQGYAIAQSNLGIRYDTGRGIPENDAEAVKWYRKAAEQGYANAQSNLGAMYYNGEGIPENHVGAYVWWSMAKTQGHKGAKGNLEILKPQMTKQQIAEAQSLAAQCYESDYKDCD